MVNRKRIKVIFLALMFLTCFVDVSTACARSAEKETTLRICRQLFSAAIDEKQNLFEVNPFYVLQVKFDTRGRLEELAVEPKYFFGESHPEWEEPVNFAYLSKGEYEVLLALLDSVKPKGVLVKPKSGSVVVTNLTAHYKKVYAHAVLEWGEIVDLRRPEDAPLEIRFFRVKYPKTKSAAEASAENADERNLRSHQRPTSIKLLRSSFQPRVNKFFELLITESKPAFAFHFGRILQAMPEGLKAVVAATMQGLLHLCAKAAISDAGGKLLHPAKARFRRD